MEDIWFVRDKFMVTKIHAFQTLRAANCIERRSIPYVYQQFNVSFGYINQAPTISSTAARMINGLVDNFNRKKKTAHLHCFHA